MKHGKGGSLLRESFIDRQVRYPIEVTGPGGDHVDSVVARLGT
jgi:hypothetical protein